MNKIEEADKALYVAQQLNAYGDPIEAWRHIEDARRFLHDYLTEREDIK